MQKYICKTFTFLKKIESALLFNIREYAFYSTSTLPQKNTHIPTYTFEGYLVMNMIDEEMRHFFWMTNKIVLKGVFIIRDLYHSNTMGDPPSLG